VIGGHIFAYGIIPFFTSEITGKLSYPDQGLDREDSCFGLLIPKPAYSQTLKIVCTAHGVAGKRVPKLQATDFPTETKRAIGDSAVRTGVRDPSAGQVGVERCSN
jgi:hypothetical protein